MKQEILDYLAEKRIGVLAVEMLDGSPHGATVHFAHADGPLTFYFETNPEYRKTEALTGREQSRATFVVGVNEEDMRTLQLDGFVRLLNDAERQAFDRVYFGKFPEKKEKYKNQVLFCFIPTRWRFTSWKSSQGKVILTSDDASGTDKQKPN